MFFSYLFVFEFIAKTIMALQPYDPSTDCFVHKIALKQFLVAKNIKDPDANSTDADLHVLIFFCSIDFVSFKLFGACVRLWLRLQKTFDELFELLKKNFGKATFKCLARKKFNEARPHDSETVEQFKSLL